MLQQMGFGIAAAHLTPHRRDHQPFHPASRCHESARPLVLVPGPRARPPHVDGETNRPERDRQHVDSDSRYGHRKEKHL
jgi:hypothetical protein